MTSTNAQQGYCQYAGGRNPCFSFCISIWLHIRLDVIYLALVIKLFFLLNNQLRYAGAGRSLFPAHRQYLLVVGNFSAPHESSTFNYMQHYLRVDSSRLLYLLGDKFHKTHNL